MTFEQDRRAIEALNQRDGDAVLSGDTAAIISQWSDDFTVIPSVGAIVRGREANAALVARGAEQMRAIEPLQYSAEFEEITVAGDFAFEWGTYRGQSRVRASGDVVSFSGKLMRILRREADGSWKMHRTMVTADRP